MKQTIILSVISWVIIGYGLAGAGFVDLSPDANGDRIAVVKDGKVAYLPAKRRNTGSRAVGGSGFASGAGADCCDSPHPTSTTAAIVVSRRCFIFIQLSILHPACRRVCGEGRRVRFS